MSLSEPASSPAVSAATTSLVTATTPATPGGAAATLVAPSSGPTEQVVALTNAERAKVGCGALVVDGRLAASAQAHSADMAINNYFSHNGRDGQSPFQRIADAGYTFSVAAENIAAGQRTAADVVAGWMNSDGHRANILNCSLTQIGVGFATGGSYGTYWTQDFGTP